MKLIKPSYTIIEQDSGIEGIYKQIELAGRTCYKSESNITEDSAKGFVDRMIKSGHGAMLEHGTVYLTIPEWDERGLPIFPDSLADNPYTKSCLAYGIWHVTTNYRVLVENNLLEYLKYLCNPTEYHEKRITVKFICDRGVSHEFVRHRVFSFAQESTRYCNYSKDKFNNEITFIIPNWLSYEEQQFTNKDDSSIRTDLSENEFFIDCLLEAERTYNYLVEYCDWKPQQARAVLPNALKTELVMTGFINDWEHFFRIRSRIAETGKPHPQAQELADSLMDEFVKRGIMETLL